MIPYFPYPGLAVTGALFILLAAAAYGVHETLQHHYAAFQRRFPHANSWYWDPQVSWMRKYKDGMSKKGPAFPGATHILVFLTDAKHLLSTLHKNGLLLGAALLGSATTAWWAAFAVAFLLYPLAFHLVYTLIFRPIKSTPAS